VPAGVLGEMIGAFSYDVDFQREVQPGDGFTVLYRRIHDEFGRPTGLGRLVYAEMVLSGTRLRLYRFTPNGGEPGYFNAVGENIKKPLLRTPVDGARLTSGFGMRLHPLLGYSRMHRGVDFGAPSGTAVYAAGDGVVVRAGRVSGYGNYVEIEHNPQYTTAYGHLSAFAHGLHDGERVRQGEVIGYVGMTGLATGPHLHYEVHYQGAQIDPLSVKMPALIRLAGDDLKAFETNRNAVERELYDLRQDLVAQYGCRPGRC
jgi:murein DD-endopeptidase MepM/ murein hydrolase activator NlpD